MNIDGAEASAGASSAGPGRPRGGRSDARERLLVEARRQFTERGYERTTLRGVAQVCGVDAALIGYHFGSKRQLFTAAVDVPVGPADVVEAATRNGTVDAERLLLGVLQAWEDPRTGPPLRSLALAALQDSAQRLALREYLERELVDALANRLSGPHRERRARAAAYVVAGAVLSHHVLGLHAASEPKTVFQDLIGPLSAALHPEGFLQPIAPERGGSARQRPRR
ncbi:MAG: TetR/AcrR family transcriptional regulator [Janthinobacterium lividum]